MTFVEIMASATREQRAAADPEKTVIISPDGIRHAMGEYWVPSREILVADIEGAAITFALKRSYTVISDGINLKKDRPRNGFRGFFVPGTAHYYITFFLAFLTF